MQATFADPVWLWLLAALPLVWWGATRLRSTGRTRRWFIVGVRTVIVLALVLALAQLEVAWRSERLTVYFLLDQSESIPAEQRAEAAETIATLVDDKRPNDEAGLIVFGEAAAIETFALPTFEFPGAINSVVSTARTDLSRAMRLALSAFPNANMRRVVLLTDGNENSGNALEVARLARNERIPVDIIPLRYEQVADVQVDKLVVPQQAARDAPFDVKVFLSSDERASGRLRLFEDGVLIADEQVDVAPGKNPPLVLKRRLEDPGFHRYEAVFEAAGDSRPQNNQAQAFTNLKGDPRVLYVEGDQENRNYLAAALQAERIRVDFVSPFELPSTLEELQSYDAIILSNVHAGDVGMARQRMIETAVKDLGVGLVMVGGENSFGAGGYNDSPIERALPVSMDVKQKKVLPNGALAVILHTCEFANGNAWAREISKAALDVLSPQDLFGIAYYGAAPTTGAGGLGGWGDFWLWEDESGSGLMQAGNKSVMKAKIDGVTPMDMPTFSPTMDLAYRGLRDARAQAKHVIIISDGDPSPPSKAFVEQMRDEGISISTVAVFPHEGTTVQTLEDIAYWGAGEFYYPKTADELPRIFIKEASVVRRSLIFEEPFQPVLDTPSATLEGFASLPQLDGYVVTSDKELATIALRTHNDDPLLAHWRYGLGKTVAFTSDAKNKWAANWVDWDGYVKFWSQVTRFALRETSGSNLQVATDLAGGRGRFTIDALDLDGNFRNFMEFDAAVIGPDMQPQPVRVRQVGPGRYEGEFEAAQVGSYMVRLTEQDEQGGQGETLVTGVAQSYSPEYQSARWNEDFLRRLAREAGGRLVEDPAGYLAFARDLPSTSRPFPLWPWLLLGALLLVPVDVLVRRVFVDELLAELWGRLAGARARADLEREQDASARATQAGALLAAKGRATAEKQREAEEERARREFRERLQAQEAQAPPTEGSVFDEKPGAAPTRQRQKETYAASDAPPRADAPAGGMSSLLEAKKRAQHKRK